MPLLEEDLAAEKLRCAVIKEVQRGLIPQPRSLAPWLFYDEKGSKLFERITYLPEYYLTRTERAIFSGYADGIIAAAKANSDKPLRLVELGAGTASKTGILLDAAVNAQGVTEYIPVDVSETALQDACESIEGSLADVVVKPVVANYVHDPIRLEPHDGPTLALYIGSSIGNFTPTEQRTILRNLRAELKPGDTLLLGADLVKDEATLLAAYDDANGVTEAFNLNVLRRINRELGANFDLACFKHVALWNRLESRIEMHLECTSPQRVRIPGAKLDVPLAKGERIHTENSYKFTPEMIRSLLADAGMHMEEIWMDERAWFAVTLGRVL